MRLSEEIMDNARKLVERLKLKRDDMVGTLHEGNQSCEGKGYMCQHLFISDIPELKHGILIDFIGVEDGNKTIMVFSRPDDMASTLRIWQGIQPKSWPSRKYQSTIDWTMGREGTKKQLLRAIEKIPAIKEILPIIV